MCVISNWFIYYSYPSLIITSVLFYVFGFNKKMDKQILILLLYLYIQWRNVNKKCNINVKHLVLVKYKFNFVLLIQFTYFW